MTSEKDRIVVRKTMKEIKKALKEGNEERAAKLGDELLDYFGWFDE